MDKHALIIINIHSTFSPMHFAMDIINNRLRPSWAFNTITPGVVLRTRATFRLSFKYTKYFMLTFPAYLFTDKISKKNPKKLSEASSFRPLKKLSLPKMTPP